MTTNTPTSIEEFYKKWCKETKRSGGVLIGSSIRELLIAFQLYNTTQPKKP